MSPYKATDCDDAITRQQSRRAKALERARKNVETRRKRGRPVRIFGGVVVLTFLVVLIEAIRKLFVNLPTIAAFTEVSVVLHLVTVMVCGMFGFKAGLWLQTFFEQLFGGTADEMLVEYHDKLDEAGLL